MSDKRPDERDIDEILASIDEMLSQKEPYSLQEDSRKDSVKEGVKASEDKLGLSSSVDAPELSEFDNIDIEEFLSLGIQDEQPIDTAKAKNEEHQAEEQTATNLEHKGDDVPATNHDSNKDESGDITESIDFTLDETDFPDFDEVPSANQEPTANEQEYHALETGANDDDNVATTNHDTNKDLGNETAENIDFTLDEIDFADFAEAQSSNQEPTANEQETQTSDIDTNHDDSPLAPTTEPQKPTDKHIHDDLLKNDLAETNSAEEAPVENKLDEGDLFENATAESEPAESKIKDKYQEDQATTEDNSPTPRHRILLTEELLEPSAQEALPLWVEQTWVEQTSTENESHDATTDAPSRDKSTEPQSSEASQEEPNQTKTAQIEEQTEEEQTTKPDLVADSSEKRSDTESTGETEEQRTTSTPQQHIDKPADKTNENSVFDLDEDIGIDTVYKLETLPAHSDDDLDNHTELVEVMMEEVLQDEEQLQNSEDEHEEATEKVFLSDDEMQNMVQAVSADVAQQINDHLQTWLPGLISIAIKNHIKDLNNNK